MSTARPALFAGLSLALGFVACGTRNDGFEAPTPPGVFEADAGIEAATECSLSCSADLRTVRDCHGQARKTCPEGTGCAPGGTCVPPCDASVANKSTIGCEFWAQPPAGAAANGPLAAGRGHCFAVLVVNAWSTPATLSLEFEGKTIDVAPHTRILGENAALAPLVDGRLPPNALGAIFLHDRPPEFDGAMYAPCPNGVTAAVVDREIAQLDQASDTIPSFRVGADVPVAAYALYPFGGADAYVTSASLLFPTSTWSKNYLLAPAVDPMQDTYASPFVQILAREDDTHVKILPKSVLRGQGTLPSADPAHPATYTLSRGHALQFVQAALAGAIVESDKPIATWGGDGCTNIGPSACDSLHQQIAPIEQLGSEYVAVPHLPRGGQPEDPRWRFMSAVNDTKLTFDPPIPAFPLGTHRAAAQDVTNFVEAQPFVVRSQDDAHPFYAWGYMTGGANHLEQGDPDFYNLIPTGQFLPEYRFYTDPTYGNTELLFVRRGKATVTLECSGPVQDFQPIGDGKYEYARVPLRRAKVATGPCKDGTHHAFSDTPFGLTVVGYDRYASYMFPAGMSAKTITGAFVPASPR